MRRPPVLAAVVIVVAGLFFGAASGAAWVLTEDFRSVGGDDSAGVLDVFPTTGGAVAPTLVAWAVLTIVAGLVLLVARGRGRRLVALAAGAAVVGAAANAALGLVRALRVAGSIASGPYLAAAGALVGLTGVALAVRGRRRLEGTGLPPRYSLDEEDAAAEEWNAASAEEEPR